MRIRRTISRRPAVLGAVSVAAALVALGLSSAAVSGAAAKARAGFVSVKVAARPLPEGSVVEPSDVRVVSVPPEAAPDGPASDPVGRTVTLPVLPGDAWVEARLAPSGRGVSALLSPGQVAAAVAPAIPLRVAVGERVRVTATFDPERFEGSDLVKVVAADAAVLAVEGEGSRLILGLEARERDQLALAQGVARIDVALLPPGP